jgi:hypothetical protein
MQCSRSATVHRWDNSKCKRVMWWLFWWRYCDSNDCKPDLIDSFVLICVVFLSFYLVIDGRGGRANILLCSGVTGEVPAVGVTGPPDFLLKRLLKKSARTSSFCIVFYLKWTGNKISISCQWSHNNTIFQE